MSPAITTDAAYEALDHAVRSIANRLAGKEGGVRALVADGCVAQLSVERWLDPGQLGLRLDDASVGFLAATGASIDIDEFLVD